MNCIWWWTEYLWAVFEELCVWNVSARSTKSTLDFQSYVQYGKLNLVIFEKECNITIPSHHHSTEKCAIGCEWETVSWTSLETILYGVRQAGSFVNRAVNLRDINYQFWIVEGVTMCTSTEFVYEFSENKGQSARIRYKNSKFHSILLDCPNSIPYSMF